MFNRRTWIPCLLAAALQAAAYGACPNLAGNYVIQGEDGRAYITIEQHGCGRIHIVRKNNYLGEITTETHDLKLDGRKHEDSPWLGVVGHFRTSARFVGSELRIEAAAKGDSALTMVYSLTPGFDLNVDGTVAKRRK